MSALLVVGVSTFVSCKDTSDDLYNDVKGQTNDLYTLIVSQANSLSDLSDELNSLKDDISSSDGVVAQLIEEKTASIKETAEEALDKANQNQTSIDNLYDAMSDLDKAKAQFGAIAELANLIQSNSDAIADLQNQLDEMKYAWSDSLKTAYETAEAALALAQADKARLDNFGGSDMSLEEIIGNMMNTDISLQDSIDVVAAKVEEALAKAEELEGKMQTLADEAKEAAIAAAKEYTDEQIAATVTDITNAYTAADDVIREELAEVRAELEELIAGLQNALNKLVTGIIIQGVSSPIFGYGNLPLDVSVNVLGAYYGQAGNYDVVFPAQNTANYVWQDEYVDITGATGLAAQTLVSANSTIMSNETYGDAGTLYLTVNPNTVDFNNLRVTLVDSRDTEAPGYEQPLELKKSDKQLTFGYTRSSENNGFYETTAKVTDPQAAKLDVDVDELKSAAKNILDKVTDTSNRLNISNIVSTLYSQFNGALVAYGVKATWKDNTANSTDSTRSVYSEYKVAATALPPLSYAFLKDGTKYSIPTIPTLESKGLIFDHFNYDPVSGVSDTISVTILIPDINNVDVIFEDDITGYVDDEGTVHINKDQLKPTVVANDSTEYTVEIPMDEFNDIIDDLNEQVSGMLSDINDMIDNYNSKVATIDKNYISKINSFINKFNNLLKNPGSVLQPTMLYGTTSGSYTQMSSVKAAASHFNLNGASSGSIILIPTSYTAELLAPAYKKIIAVTSVEGASDNAAALTYANGGTNMNQVIDGSIHNVMFQANQTGTYEITYSAVDYSGKIVTKKYYVKVIK
ncbi:MAG: hypothetical protein Q4D41_11715 [Prevotellaceae bacterium]|nr:hypothetical protein [Prevotellaceae bacterium]